MEAEARERVVSIVAGFTDAEAMAVTDRHLSLEVRGKRFGWYMEDHHGNGRLEINCKAPPGFAASLVAEDPERIHIPKYVGKKGWAGIWVDGPNVEWERVREVLELAYHMTASPERPAGRSGKRR